MERVQTKRARRHRHRLLLAPAARLAFPLFLHASVCDSASMDDGDLPIYNGYRVLRSPARAMSMISTTILVTPNCTSPQCLAIRHE